MKKSTDSGSPGDCAWTTRVSWSPDSTLTPKSGRAGEGSVASAVLTNAASVALSGSEPGSTLSRVCTGMQIVSQMPRKTWASMVAGWPGEDTVKVTGSDTGRS